MPLILDSWAKPELGSGCVKITPAHDPNDYDVWRRHRNEIGIVLASTGGARRKFRRIVEITRATYANNQVLRSAVARDDEMTLGPIARSFTRDQERKTIDLLRRLLEQGVKEGSLRRIDPERVAYLMFHLGSVLVARETSGAGDYPFGDIMTVMDDVFARGIRKPRGKRG